MIRRRRARRREASSDIPYKTGLMEAKMPVLSINLELSRCPHCSVDTPNLQRTGSTFNTTDYQANNKRFWASYRCARCGGIVTAGSETSGGEVSELYPKPPEVAETLPPRARNFLQQAINSLHAPAGAVMLAASSVDVMLKQMGYKDGSLYSRINQAAEDHLITDDMAKWAHEVRLDANNQRHADVEASLPSPSDAQHCIDFVVALGQFLFVFPARIERGRAEAQT